MESYYGKVVTIINILQHTHYVNTVYGARFTGERDTRSLKVLTG